MTPILLDSIVGIVILLSVVFAFFRGFVKEMLTIVNLVGAAGAAYFIGPRLLPFFNEQLGVKVVEQGVQPAPEAVKIWGIIPPEIMAMFLSYTACFFAVFLILTLAGLYISGTVKALGLGPLDKTLGVAFGAVRGFLLAFLFYLPFGYFMTPDQHPDWAKKSISVAFLQDAYEYGDKYLNKPENGEAGEEDPSSYATRMKKMADEMSEKQPANGDDWEEDEGDLTSDERTENR